MMNATKKKRLLAMGGTASPTTSVKSAMSDTVYSPDGKPAVTTTGNTVIVHEKQLLDAVKYFLPADTKIIVGPHLSEVDLSGEIRQ